MITAEQLYYAYIEAWGYSSKSHPYTACLPVEKLRWEHVADWCNKVAAIGLNATGYDEAIRIIVTEWPKEMQLRLYKMLFNAGCRI